MGEDLHFSDVEGMKVWVQYSSVKASAHLDINIFVTDQSARNTTTRSQTTALQDVTLQNVRSVPG